MHSPKLSEAVFYAILAVISFMAAKYGDRWPEWLRASLVLAGLVFLVTAAMAAISWLSYVAVVRYERYREATAITERTILLEKVSMLTADQTAMIEAGRPVIEILGGSPGPVYSLRTGTLDIPMSFVKEFMTQSNDLTLCPIRTWGEGTERRDYAATLTDYLVGFGFAKPASGNKPATWIDRNGAQAWLGL